MLEFSDAPYRFFPSKPWVPMIWLTRFVNRRHLLPGKKHRISTIEIRGGEKVVKLKADPSARLLFVPNHPTHSDPQTVSEIQRRLGVDACFMAAYDVFLRSRANAFIMQRNGAFSIDREASDRKAVAEAVEVLSAGRYGLTIFPEGNVHFTNDRVTPFLDGASFVAARAQKALGQDGTVYAIPLALKFTHLTDVRSRVRESLSALARAVGESVDADMCPVGELMRVGRIILVHFLFRHGFLSGREKVDMLGGGDLFENLNQSALLIVSELEKKIGVTAAPDDDPQTRIRKIRTSVHQILTDPKREIEHGDARAWANEAILVLRILGYCTPYASENPTLDRVAETVEKLNEDFFNRATPEPFGERAAIAEFGEPIDLSKEFGAASPKTRTVVATLTKGLEDSIQSTLDKTNAALSTPGSEPFSPATGLSP